MNNDISITQNAFIQCHDDLMVVCKEGSNAHAYAVENNIRYELLPPVDFGDTDENGSVTIRDAALILQYIAGLDVILGA